MRDTRLPPWLVRPHADPAARRRVSETVRAFGLATVCDEALCPNRVDCLSWGTATFMVLGDVCTRGCGFCAVRRGTPRAVDPDEPSRVAAAARALELSFVVVTSVTRDDLPDGGAGHLAATVETLRKELPGAGIEVLVPDFGGDASALQVVLDSGPDVLGHNVETVERLYPTARKGAAYERSLALLERAARGGFGGLVKSALMLGLGETRAEVDRTLDDLGSVGVDIVCIGQYLRPSSAHLAVARYVAPSEFADVRAGALRRGFRSVAAGPFVRSSYRAESAAQTCAVSPAPRGGAPRKEIA